MYQFWEKEKHPGICKWGAGRVCKGKGERDSKADSALSTDHDPGARAHKPEIMT